MLTAFLLGLASGAGAARAYFLKRRRRADPRVALCRPRSPRRASLSFAAAYAIQALPRLFAEIYFRLSPSPEGWWVAQLGIALFVMFPTTYALGWVFPLVLDAAGRQPARGRGPRWAGSTPPTRSGTIVGAAVRRIRP